MFEDRDSRTGRTIDLNIVVLPALAEDKSPDPIFVLVGGPGAAATLTAGSFADGLREHRDIVLVDQRGTGRSNQLQCSAPTLGESINAMLTFDFYRPDECRAGLDADLTKYTTNIAMDDLDEVRGWLGYDQINLYGVSYGTRAAFVYMRRHGEHVRSSTLRGVAPPALLVPEQFALHSQWALDRLFADCEADEACRAAFPDPRGELDRVLKDIARDPVDIEVELPQGETTIALRFDDNSFASTILLALYGSNSARTAGSHLRGPHWRLPGYRSLCRSVRGEARDGAQRRDEPVGDVYGGRAVLRSRGCRP